MEETIDYTREQILEDVAEGAAVVKAEVERVLLQLKRENDKLRGVALLWSKAWVRISVWMVQSVFCLVVWLFGWPVWICLVVCLFGGVLSVPAAIYRGQRKRVVMTVTRHVNAVFAKEFDTVWMELMLMKHWGLMEKMPFAGRGRDVRKVNGWLMKNEAI